MPCSTPLRPGRCEARPLAVLVRNPTGSGPLENVTQVSLAHRHTCARLTNARVRCWGGNTFGQLGDGTTTSRLLPRLVVAGNGSGPLEDVAQVVAGEQHTCARKVGQARLYRSFRERMLRLGSIEIIPSDDACPSGEWRTIKRPAEVLATIEATVRRAKQGGACGRD